MLTPYRGLMWHLHIVIMPLASYCDFESFADTSKVFQVFQIQIQSKNLLQIMVQIRKPNLVSIQISASVFAKAHVAT